jgi:hypothetical protein
LEPAMGAVLVIQVDNLIPIVLNYKRSLIRGIRGTDVLSGYMEHL